MSTVVAPSRPVRWSTWLIIGDAAEPGLDEVRRSLVGNRLVVHATIKSALRTMAVVRPAIDWILLLQSRSGEFAAADVDRLRIHLPLAPVVAVLGPWCDGELRTGMPIAGIVRVPWHQWCMRIETQLQAIRLGHCPPWALPSTASDEERQAASRQQRSAANHQNALIQIVSADADLAEWLCDTCIGLGWHAVWARPDEGPRTGAPSVVVWVERGVEPPADDDWRRWTNNGAIRSIVIASFARGSDHQRWHDAGARAVLNKPIALVDLQDAIAQSLSQ